MSETINPSQPDGEITDKEPVAESGGLLQRWSRNKAQAQSDVQVEADVEAAHAPHEPVLEQSGEHQQALETASPDASDPSPPGEAGEAGDADEEILLTDADMPSLDTLDANSDYSGFMNKGVSPELRQKALQHLFRMPKFNLRDGLNDYDEDYTVFEPLGDTITSDMRWHAARKEREAREAEEAREALAAEANAQGGSADEQPLEQLADDQSIAADETDPGKLEQTDTDKVEHEAEDESGQAETFADNSHAAEEQLIGESVDEKDLEKSGGSVSG